VTRLRAAQGDITTLDVEAIVNAANSGLQPGTGVDGAIRRAAGADLTQATAALGGCPTGEAVITPGFRLRAKWVIHTAAPIFAHHGQTDSIRLLTNCYRNALALADWKDIASIAFPALGTGVYGVPMALACPIAVAAARAHVADGCRQSEILFCCYSADDLSTYERELRNG
jgi:O-acetyl-ADP-ribose deacetylase (regulator of RNase III)